VWVLAADQTHEIAARDVFVDPSGHRAIVGRVVGVGIGTVVVAYLAAFVFSLLGVSWVPPVDLPLVADRGQSHETDAVAHDALMAQTLTVTGSVGSAPGAQAGRRDFTSVTAVGRP
jgi:hypothetical protein